MHIQISKEIATAIAQNKPVVALESTIISHGMPYPQNVQCATLLEQTVRDNGAIPATIAIINGTIKVGLSKDEIEFLATSKVEKVSRRDIGSCMVKKLSGATTVSATMIIARAANIKVFATGGIGGVHRGAEQTMDISADLEELSKTPVIVVCSGVKSILDIEKTLEYLETKGVCVAGYKTDNFPAFYLRESGFKCDCSVDSREAASIFTLSANLGIHSGLLVAVPVPTQHQIDAHLVNGAISKALEKAQKENIKGKAITPYLLKEITQITKGKSLETNIELVKNNALVASTIAVELAALEQS